MGSLKMTALVVIVAAAAARSLAFEMVETSGERISASQGDELRLYCESDVPYTFCMWDHLPTGTKCAITAESVDSTCVRNSRIFWDQSGNRCGIMIEAADRVLDSGAYACTLTVSDAELLVARSTTEVDIVVPSEVHFGEDMNGVDVYPVTMMEAFVVECHANGGFPHSEVVAYLGEEEGPIDDGVDEALMATEGAFTLEENEDGTANVAQYFTYVPHMSDCGKYLKCASSQTGEDGEIIFDIADYYSTQKIMVQFPPQPIMDAQQATVTFTPGDAEAWITLTFMANPVPQNNEAIWHITPEMEEEMPMYYDDNDNSSYVIPSRNDVIVIQSDSMDGGKYEALPLNISGHTVTATLKIYNLIQEDMDYEYDLSVITAAGEKVYDVMLVVHQDNSGRASDNEERQPDSYGGSGGYVADPTNEASVGGGTIAAIVVVILIVFFGLGFVFWAKRYNRCCFHHHHHTHVHVVKNKNAPETRDADVEVGPTTRLAGNADNGNKVEADEEEKPESEKKLKDNNAAAAESGN